MVLQTTKRRTSGLSRDDVPRRPHSKTVFDTPLPCTESINHMVGQWMECIFTRLEILEKQSVSADDRSSPEEGGRHPIRTLRNASEPIQDGVSGAFATACHVPTHQRLHDRHVLLRFPRVLGNNSRHKPAEAFLPGRSSAPHFPSVSGSLTNL